MWGRSGGRHWEARGDRGCGQPIIRPSSVSPGLTPDQKWDKVYVRAGIKARPAVGQHLEEDNCLNCEPSGGQLPRFTSHQPWMSTFSVIHWRSRVHSRLADSAESHGAIPRPTRTGVSFRGIFLQHQHGYMIFYLQSVYKAVQLALDTRRGRKKRIPRRRKELKY